MRWVRSPDYLAGLAFFFLSLLFFYDLLGGRYLLTERDLVSYFIPPRFFWAESLKHGSFPLWNPYQFSGHPFFANPQHAVLYPLNLLFLFLPFDIAFNGVIILHFFLGGLFTTLLLKDFKINSTGAFVSGLIFMLSGYLLSVHSLLTILLSSIWTPLIMMFFRRAICGQGFKNEIFAAVSITLSFLGGGIEIVYGNFFVLLLMVVCSPYPKPLSLSNWSPVWLRGRSLLVIFVLFLFLSAIQLIPFIELWFYSVRSSGVTLEEATTWSFAPKDILLFFLPDAYGYFLDMKKYWGNQCWFKTLYTGGLPFILSVIYFLSSHPRGERDIGEPGRYRKLFLGLILFSLFLSLGHYNPLYPFIFKYLPFFNGIRYPAKFLFIFILILSITAGFGFQKLTEITKENKGYKNLFIVSSLACGLVLLLLVWGHKEVEYFLKLRGIDVPQFNPISVNLFNVKRFVFYLALFFLVIRVGLEVKWKGWTRILLILLLVGDLFGNMGFYGKEKSSDYFRKTKISEVISSDSDWFRLFSTAKTISHDTAVLTGDTSYLNLLKEKHIPSMNLLYSLHDIWGIDVIHLKRADDLYRTFTSTPSISATNLIDLYGVKYVVSVTPIEKDPRFELIYSRLEGLQGKEEDLLKENTIKLYKVRNHFPRAWLVKDFEILDAHTMLSRMLTKEFHPDQEVLLEEEPIQLRNAEWGVRSGLPGEVEFISEKCNQVHLRVRAREDALLVLSDTYYPGWKAFVYPVRSDSYNQVNSADTKLSNRVNGKEERIYRADYNFRAIFLKAGEHEVRFRYDPISFKIGMVVSLLTLVGIAAYFVGRSRRIVSTKMILGNK